MLEMIFYDHQERSARDGAAETSKSEVHWKQMPLLRTGRGLIGDHATAEATKAPHSKTTAGANKSFLIVVLRCPLGVSQKNRPFIIRPFRNL